MNEEIDQIKEEIYRAARNLALGRLNRREYSSFDITEYLKKKGASLDTIHLVITNLIAERILDDERYSNLFIKDQLHKGKGPLFIRQKLKMHGIDLPIERIREVTEEVSDQSEVNQALTLLKRRYPQAHRDLREKQRAYQGLIRRGFSHSATREALLLLKEMLAE